MRIPVVVAGLMVAAAICATPTSCPSACPAYSFSTAQVTSDPNPLSFGFQFRTNDAVTLSALGYFDDGRDGFTVPHDIGIFDSGGVLLAFVSLPAGTGDTLIGDFRYRSITPVSLLAGELFTVAATTNGRADPWAYGVVGSTITGFSNDPAIQIDLNAGVFTYGGGAGLQYPTEHFGYSLYAGPNFLIDGPGVITPEPGSAILLCSALGVLALVNKIRRKASVPIANQDRHR